MSGLWWNDKNYPNLAKEFDEALVLVSSKKGKTISQAETLQLLIEFYKKRREK